MCTIIIWVGGGGSVLPSLALYTSGALNGSMIVIEKWIKVVGIIAERLYTSLNQYIHNYFEGLTNAPA